MGKKILKLIERSKKVLDKKSQKAELLMRNEKFQKELNKFFDWLPDVNKFFIVKRERLNGFSYYSYSNLRRGLERIKEYNILIKLKYSKYKHKNWITRESRYFAKGEE